METEEHCEPWDTDISEDEDFDWTGDEKVAETEVGNDNQAQ